MEFEYNENANIQVTLDQSNLHMTSLMKTKLLEAYRNFAEGIMIECEKLPKAANFPIEIEPVFGHLDFDHTMTMAPGFILGYLKFYFRCKPFKCIS